MHRLTEFSSVAALFETFITGTNCLCLKEYLQEFNICFAWKMLKLLAAALMFSIKNLYTVNVDIFACIHFRGFMKMGNFAGNEICVLIILVSKGFYKGIFRSVYIFVDI